MKIFQDTDKRYLVRDSLHLPENPNVIHLMNSNLSDYEHFEILQLSN